MTPHYSFTAELWLYPGEAAWHFITLPEDYSTEIKTVADQVKRGFGSVKVEATIGKSTWRTSIFPDTKSKSYILPIKKEVRTANNLNAGDQVKVELSITGL